MASARQHATIDENSIFKSLKISRHTFGFGDGVGHDFVLPLIHMHHLLLVGCALFSLVLDPSIDQSLARGRSRS
jgi:hypothetical protein